MKRVSVSGAALFGAAFFVSACVHIPEPKLTPEQEIQFQMSLRQHVALLIDSYGGVLGPAVRHLVQVMKESGVKP